MMNPPMIQSLPFSPLSLNQLTRDYWGSFDAVTIAQLAGLAEDDCYSIKFYKAPADNQEVLAAGAYVPYGLRVTPGSVIFGFYQPGKPNLANLALSTPAAFTVQITDQSLKHRWFSDPISSLFLANYKPTGQRPFFTVPSDASFPNLLCAPYAVVGSGLFLVEIQSTSASSQRIELVIGALEVCK